MKVRANRAVVVWVEEDGMLVPVKDGELFDSKSSVVKEHGELFEPAGSAVEQATAAPGEKRQTTRA